jgi:membrane-associated phospholipid phosphatase
MQVITDFGSPALLLPMSLLICLRLWLRTGPRLALLWLLALAAGTGLTALLKIYFSACGLAPSGIHSPSGHACFSTLVYGGLIVFCWVGSSPRRRIALAVLGIGWIGLIAYSRVAVGAHSPGEVVSGTIIGAAALGSFSAFYLRADPPRASLLLPLAGAILVVAPLHGHQLAIEPLLKQIGSWLHHALPICFGS